jgi:hypothetical protein
LIRALRARHRAIFALLAVLVPAGYAAALLGRRGPPPESDWPADALLQAPDGTPRVVLWSEIELLTELRRGEGGALFVRALSWSEPAAPALALYWCASEPADGELPEDARFVGALGGASAAPRDLVLRDAPENGWLVLYSLGHGEVQDALELEDG